MNIQIVKPESANPGSSVIFVLANSGAEVFTGLFSSQLSLGGGEITVAGAILPETASAEDIVLHLQTCLPQEGLRRFTLLGLGRASAAALLLAAQAPKFVRRLILLDADILEAQTLLGRLVGAVDNMLPIGLPLRSHSSGFDPRPMLHRINCPSLVLLSPNCSEAVKTQAKLIADRIPNSWVKIFSAPVFDSSGSLSEDFTVSLAQFVQVPTKRSQKVG